MPTKEETQSEAVRRRQSTGYRYQCFCCKTDLPGSNPASDQVSHGLCAPLCKAAIDMGYGNYIKST